MTSSGIYIRRPVRVLLALLLGVVLASVASPAFAHDELVGTEPAIDSTIDTLPGELVLTFSGVLLDEPGATAVEVVDSSCTSLTSGDPVLDGTKLTQPVTPGADGVVTVLWRVVSSDGHPTSGEYSFTVGDSGPAEPCAAGPDEQPDSDGLPVGLIVTVLAGGAIAVGGGALALWVTRRRARRED